LLIATAFVGAGIAVFTWWQRLPPGNHGSWNNQVSRHPGQLDTTVPHYDIGGFSVNFKDESIGYIVRITDPSQLADPKPWLVYQRGQVFVNGRLVPYQSGKFRLYVADGHEAPKRVILSAQDAQAFNSVGHNFESCEVFWTEVLQKKYIPDLNVHP